MTALQKRLERNRIAGSGRRRWWWQRLADRMHARRLLFSLAVIFGVSAVAAPNLACDPTVVLARFSDGTPSFVKVIGPEHTDYDLIGAGDRACASAELFGVPCINWHKPRETDWHQHGYTSCCVNGGWTPIYWSEWDPFYSAVYYPQDEYSQQDHDFLLYVEGHSGV